MTNFLWQHGIDIEQDAVVQAAIKHWRLTTGAFVDQHTILKIIIMRYAKEMENKEQRSKSIWDKKK